MRLIKLTNMMGILVLATAAMNAAVITLTFEGLKDSEPINNYYNGGLGGSGSGPGPNYGITFTSDSLALISNQDGGTGNFDGQPSGVTVAFFLTGAGDTMNVAAGFTSGFSFYYSSPFFPGSVTVWSGPNGTGTQLAMLSLPTTTEGLGVPPCNDIDQYCPWVPFGVTFSGTAESVVFTGTANRIGFDNITLGSDVPTGAVPEPASSLLIISGLSVLGVAARRFRKRI